MSKRAGDRVGVMLGINAETNTIEFLGYGEYLGDEVPPAEVSAPLHNAGIPNPKIRLDNGKIVWGFETWWGAADSFKRKLIAWEQDDWTIVEVDIDEARAQIKQRSDDVPGTTSQSLQ